MGFFRPLWDGWKSPIALAAAVFAFFFGLYGVTASSFVGYEGETAATTQGLVETGQLRLIEHDPLGFGFNTFGRGGHRYSRTGLTQPLLEAPFYAVGAVVDSAVSGKKNWTFRLEGLYLYNAFMTAVAAAALFGLVFMRRGSRGWALVIALLFGCASIAWPYSKAGMETTAMALVCVAFFMSVWASRSRRPLAYACAGFATGAMAASKPYMLVVVPALAVLLWEGLREMPSRDRRRCVLLATAPLLIWLVAIAWYNWYRTGSITDFRNPYREQAPLSAPFNALGLFLSPGKGLLLFSPLALLGLVGLRQLWIEDRFLATAIGVAVLANTAVIALTPFWSDETWGPRYLVPVAGLLILPVAWWARPGWRIRAVAIAAGVGVLIQLAAVWVAYPPAVQAQRELTGQPVYPIGEPGKVPALGNDGPRWVPQLSQLLVQAEIVAAWTDEQVTGKGFTVDYHPYSGPEGRTGMQHPASHFNTRIPDFLWTSSPREGDPLADRTSLTGFRLVAAALFLVCIFFGIQILREMRVARQRHLPERSPPPASLRGQKK